MAALRIGELLIAEGLITSSQLETALKAQQIFGGRLGTNLVEHGFVNEVDLARLLARQLGIRVVEPQDLADVDPAIIGLIPPELARRHHVVPFRYDEQKDRVSLAVADPTNLQKVDEIQFALGRTVDFHISPEILLAFAMERYYGVERPKRYIRLTGVADAEMQVVPRDGAATPAQRTGASPSRVRRSPNEALLSRIVDAPSKRELVTAITDALGERSEQLLFLAARGNELIAWESRGLPVEPSQLRAVSVSADASALLSDVVRTCRHRSLAGLDEEPLRTTFEESLFLDCSGSMFVLPLIVNRKVFGVFLFSRFDEPTFVESVPLLVELMKRVACKLQVFYLMDYLTAPL